MSAGIVLRRSVLVGLVLGGCVFAFAVEAVLPRRTRSAIEAPTDRSRRDPPPLGRARARLARLSEIERRVLPPPLVPGPHRYATLPEYYGAENPELLARFQEAKAAFHRSPRPALHELTLVAGAAGVGKTFLKREVFSKAFPAGEICKLDLRELYDQWAAQGITADKPDLASGSLAINHLKTVVDKSRARIREHLEAHDASFYVIDSLDEIHPDDYAWVLEQIEEFVRGDRRFVHAAVFGRGFAFREFWNGRRASRRTDDVELYVLNPPAFRTLGDLCVSSWNYHVWRYKLKWAPDAKASAAMPLDAYAAWAKSGFARTGPFRSITCENNDDMCAEVQDALADWAARSRVVCSMLYNLAGNSIVRDIVRRETLLGHAYDERHVAEAYLDAWLARESRSHDRPSLEKPQYLDLYLMLLERTAVKYLKDGAVDDQGYFPVREGDAITVRYGGRDRTFPVRRILDRSGLIVTNPCDPSPARYRFEPIWMHRLLVQMYGEPAVGHRPLASAALGAE